MIVDKDYKLWIHEIKSKIRSAQMKAALSINATLIHFYWDLGKMLHEKQESAIWGSKLIEQVSLDLKDEFPLMHGFSVSNLKTCRLFYQYFTSRSQLVNQLNTQLSLISSHAVNQIDDANSITELFVRSIVAQIPWGHIKVIITKLKDLNEAYFYIQKTKENNWGRETLALQIKAQLYERQGKSINNFKETLPGFMSDLAIETLKDPYLFDFVSLTEGYKERELENQLVGQISKFLLELGKGFAYVGQQYPLAIADQDYYLDLLFYHIKLKCYVVIELKNTKFVPEYAGKMNFYLSAVDTLLKQKDDKPTIGILLCRNKNNIEAEFALRDINKPIGVSEFVFTEIVPEEYKSSLPTIEELENSIELLNTTHDEN